MTQDPGPGTRDSKDRSNDIRDRFDLALYLKSLLPTLLGVFCFMVPIPSEGGYTIPIAIIGDMLKGVCGHIGLELVVGFILSSVIGSIWYLWRRPDWQTTEPTLHRLFACNGRWFSLRVAGALLAISVYWQVGPEWLWGETTGRAVFVEIGVSILFIVIPACYLMILLTDFGFMEFAGTLLRRPFEYLFGLPGRSAIDATASFVSASSVGALITIRQYERGFYTAREACAVATNFSVVSIPFSLVIAQAAGISDLYFAWYGTVILACGLCAVLTVRVPPLAGISDSYYSATGKQVHEVAHGGRSLPRWAVNQAMERARHAPGALSLLREGTRMWLEIMVGILGPALLIATATTIGVFQTPVFDWLTQPLVPFLEFVGLRDAATAAPGFISGLLDQFTPALIAQRVDNNLTRFVLAGLSICQLVYLSELGLILLRSSLPLQLRHLLAIFALRTVIVFPVFLMMGHLLAL